MKTTNIINGIDVQHIQAVIENLEFLANRLDAEENAARIMLSSVKRLETVLENAGVVKEVGHA